MLKCWLCEIRGFHIMNALKSDREFIDDLIKADTNFQKTTLTEYSDLIKAHIKRLDDDFVGFLESKMASRKGISAALRDEYVLQRNELRERVIKVLVEKQQQKEKES